MTQPKIPARLPVGSAEFYAEMLRDSPRNPDNFYAYAMGLVAHIVDDADLQILVRAQRIRNVVAAVELIRDESTPGMDYQRDTADGSVPGPRRAPHFEDGRDPGVAVVEPETGERVEVGADGCGCPVTEEIRPNDSSINGTERVEHRAGCWNAAELTASGLTPAADQSRGVLAGTTPVVAYFSFGHGQTDPQSGMGLLGHYVTVVAPTYEECREAMFASRFGRAWSFDYLAGREKTTEWVSQWTEHEVIVAPGTDAGSAEAALKAASDLLAAEPYEPQPGEIVHVQRWGDTKFRVANVAGDMAEVFSLSGNLSGWVPVAEVRSAVEPVSEAR